VIKPARTLLEPINPAKPLRKLQKTNEKTEEETCVCKCTEVGNNFTVAVVKYFV
jgi:hypothetical protein